MERAFGRIIAVHASGNPPRAEVEVDGNIICERCASGRGCGAALLGATNQRRRIAAWIGSGIDVKAGDEVRMELEPRRLLRASWLVYGIPLTGALVAAGAAYLAGLRDPYTAGVALIGVGAGLVIARSRLRKTACLQQFTPTIVALVRTVR